jgi:hypothetical protein
MLIKCTQCGHENQLGAIFCRDCGAKLNIEELSPELKDKKPRGCFKIGCKIFILLFLLFVTSVTLILFFPLNYSEYEPISVEQQEKVDEKIDLIKSALSGKSKKRMYIFTPGEASFALNKVIREMNNDEYAGVDIIVECLDGVASVIVQKKFLGVLRFRMELKGRPVITQNAQGNTVFEPNMEYFKFGNIPVSLPAEKFREKMDTPELKRFFEKIKKFEIDKDDNFVILFKKPPRPIKGNSRR